MSQHPIVVMTSGPFYSSTTSSPPTYHASPVSRKLPTLGHTYGSAHSFDAGDSASPWTWTCSACGHEVTTAAWLARPIQEQWDLLFPCQVRMVRQRLDERGRDPHVVVASAPVHGVLAAETLARIFPGRTL